MCRGIPSAVFDLQPMFAEPLMTTGQRRTEDRESQSGRARAASEAGAGDNPTAIRSIEDLDIETIQWLSDDLQEGFALYDPEDRLVVANAEYSRLHAAVADILAPGMAFEEMIRAMVIRGSVRVPVGKEEEFIAARVAQHRNPAGTVLRRLADGSAYIISEMRLPDGSIISRENDVSEIVSAKEALHESEERFKALAEIASDWFWESDENHMLLSTTLPQRLGAGEVSDLIGMTRWEIADADVVNDPHWARHKADLDAHRPFKDFVFSCIPSTGIAPHHRVTGGAVFNNAGLAIGYRSIPNNDGGRRHFSVSGVPIFDRQGEFLGYRGTTREITKEILAERRAAAAHQQLLDAVEALPESFVLCDAEDRIVLCNSATYTRLPWCKALIEPGMKFEDALREMAFSGTAPGALGREEDWVRTNLEKHRAAAGQRQYRGNDGRWVQVTERKTAEGGTVVIRADITDDKQVELEREAALMQAREENRATSTFLANCTRELRSPLDRISAMAEKLAAAQADDGDAAAAIRDAAEEALFLVNDMLNISRIQAGKYRFEPIDIDVASLIEECCARFNEEDGRPEIVADVSPTVGLVHADVSAMRHLLVSVIRDAWDRDAGAAALIHISAVPVGDKIEIGIHNPAAELDRTDLDAVMDPFRRAHLQTPSRGANVFGVRLAVASALAAEIGAILSVTAPDDGGTRLLLTMPKVPTAD